MQQNNKNEARMAAARALRALGILNTRTLQRVAGGDNNALQGIIAEVMAEPQDPAIATKARAVISELGSPNTSALPPQIEPALSGLREVIARVAVSLQREADDRVRGTVRQLTEEHESELVSLREEIDGLRQDATELETSLTEERAASADRERELEHVKAELASAHAERRSHASACEAERASLRDEVAVARESAQVAEKAERAAQIALEREQSAHEATNRTLSDLQARHDTLTATVGELSAARGRAEQERDQNRAEAEALRARLKAEVAVAAELAGASRARPEGKKGPARAGKTKNSATSRKDG